MKRTVSIILALVMMLSMLAACGDSGSSTAGGTPSDSSSADVTLPDAATVKLGVVIWGTTDALARNATMMMRKIVEAAGGEVVVDTSGTSPETQIQSAENLIAGGCNAIIIVNNSDEMLPRLAQLCETNEVYFGLMWRKIYSEEIKAQLDACPYYIGNTCEDETEIAERLATNLANAGVTQLAMIGRPIGDTTHDARWQGVVNVCENTGLDLIAEYRGQGGAATAAETMEAVEKFISGYPDLEAIFMTGGTSSQLEGALAALDKHNKRGVIKLAVVDFIDADLMKEYLDDGTLFSIAGGHYVDPLFTTAMLINAVEGNKLSDKPEQINLQFIDFASAEDAVDYYDYVENDADEVYAYTSEELGQLIKSINPDVTIDTIRQTAADYSIADVMTRHGN